VSIFKPGRKILALLSILIVCVFFLAGCNDTTVEDSATSSTAGGKVVEHELEKTISIQGVVRDRISGVGVDSVEVACYYKGKMYTTETTKDADPNSGAATSGYYSFDDIPAGAVNTTNELLELHVGRKSASASSRAKVVNGYYQTLLQFNVVDPEVYNCHECAGDASSDCCEEVYRIIEINAVKTVNIDLYKQGHLTGKVVDENGTAISGAEVYTDLWALDFEKPTTGSSGNLNKISTTNLLGIPEERIFSTTTGTDGTFSLEALREDLTSMTNYKINIIAEGYIPVEVDTTDDYKYADLLYTSTGNVGVFKLTPVISSKDELAVTMRFVDIAGNVLSPASSATVDVDVSNDSAVGDSAKMDTTIRMHTQLQIDSNGVATGTLYKLNYSDDLDFTVSWPGYVIDSTCMYYNSSNICDLQVNLASDCVTEVDLGDIILRKTEWDDCTLTGFVYDQTTKTLLSDVRIAIRVEGVNEKDSSVDVHYVATTDSDGQFSISNFPAKDYSSAQWDAKIATISKDDYVTRKEVDVSADIGDISEQGGLEVALLTDIYLAKSTLNQLASFSGYLINRQTGLGDPNFTISLTVKWQLSGTSRTKIYQATTDSNGFYTFVDTNTLDVKLPAFELTDYDGAMADNKVAYKIEGTKTGYVDIGIDLYDTSDDVTLQGYVPSGYDTPALFANLKNKDLVIHNIYLDTASVLTNYNIHVIKVEALAGPATGVLYYNDSDLTYYMFSSVYKSSPLKFTFNNPIDPNIEIQTNQNYADYAGHNIDIYMEDASDDGSGIPSIDANCTIASNGMSVTLTLMKTDDAQGSTADISGAFKPDKLYYFRFKTLYDINGLKAEEISIPIMFRSIDRTWTMQKPTIAASEIENDTNYIFQSNDATNDPGVDSDAYADSFVLLYSDGTNALRRIYNTYSSILDANSKASQHPLSAIPFTCADIVDSDGIVADYVNYYAAMYEWKDGAAAEMITDGWMSVSSAVGRNTWDGGYKASLDLLTYLQDHDASPDLGTDAAVYRALGEGATIEVVAVPCTAAGDDLAIIDADYRTNDRIFDTGELELMYPEYLSGMSWMVYVMEKTTASNTTPQPTVVFVNPLTNATFTHPIFNTPDASYDSTGNPTNPDQCIQITFRSLFDQKYKVPIDGTGDVTTIGNNSYYYPAADSNQHMFYEGDDRIVFSDTDDLDGLFVGMTINADGTDCTVTNIMNVAATITFSGDNADCTDDRTNTSAHVALVLDPTSDGYKIAFNDNENGPGETVLGVMPIGTRIYSGDHYLEITGEVTDDTYCGDFDMWIPVSLEQWGADASSDLLDFTHATSTKTAYIRPYILVDVSFDSDTSSLYSTTAPTVLDSTGDNFRTTNSAQLAGLTLTGTGTTITISSAQLATVGFAMKNDPVRITKSTNAIVDTTIVSIDSYASQAGSNWEYKVTFATDLGDAGDTISLNRYQDCIKVTLDSTVKDQRGNGQSTLSDVLGLGGGYRN